MKKKNSLLLVTEDDEVQFSIGGSTPVAKLTKEQFSFMMAAIIFFVSFQARSSYRYGYGWADSLEM